MNFDRLNTTFFICPRCCYCCCCIFAAKKKRKIIKNVLKKYTINDEIII